MEQLLHSGSGGGNAGGGTVAFDAGGHCRFFEYINFQQRYNIDARIAGALKRSKQYLEPLSKDQIPRNSVDEHVRWLKSKPGYNSAAAAEYRRAKSSEQLRIVENLQELYTTAGVLLVDAQGHGIISAKIALTVHDTFHALMLAELDRNGKTTPDIFEKINLRDRDASFGLDFREQVRDLGIQEVLSRPRSPWQRAYVERVIGSIRRECLDHVIVFHEASLRRTLNLYFDYYHRSRTHLSLGKDSPEPRPVQPPELGRVVADRKSADCTTATNDGLPKRSRIYRATNRVSWPFESSPNRVPSHTHASANLRSPASSSSANCLSFAVLRGK
jgi:hypothetical protein